MPKRNAEEKVGVIGTKNGKYNIVEYSEFPPSMAGECLADGTLKFNHGQILVFVVRVDLLLKLCSGAPGESNALYHRAHKKITHANPDTWEQIVPASENGWKFELFVHGFLPMVDSGKLGVLEVDRETEFAPVKNADGPSSEAPVPDSPACAKMMILAEGKKWLKAVEAEGL